MPFAFSTLGCPEYTLDEVLDLAVLKGVDGVELRAAPGAIVSVESPPDQIDAVRAACDASGVRILALSSYLRTREAGDDDAFERDMAAHLRVAARLGAPYLRVFPGGIAEDPDGDVRAVRRLATAAPLAAELGVRPALETHDTRRRGAQVARILTLLDERAPGHGVGAIWDAMHPWRAGEAPADTARELAPWLAFVQIKDGDVSDPVTGEDGALREVGDGRLPLDELAALLSDRVGLWWSLEWERLWHPELVDLPTALDSASAWYRQAVGVRG
jgi:sugar phosphate isomerase/epimerase